MLLAAAAFFGLGAVWYGPLFGEVWRRESGVDEEQAGSTDLRALLVATFVLELAAAIGLATVVGPDPDLGAALRAGAGLAGFVVVPVLGVLSLYEQRSVTLWALNAGYNLAGFVLMGAIIGGL